MFVTRAKISDSICARCVNKQGLFRVLLSRSMVLVGAALFSRSLQAAAAKAPCSRHQLLRPAPRRENAKPRGLRPLAEHPHSHPSEQASKESVIRPQVDANVLTPPYARTASTAERAPLAARGRARALPPLRLPGPPAARGAPPPRHWAQPRCRCSQPCITHHAAGSTPCGPNSDPQSLLSDDMSTTSLPNICLLTPYSLTLDARDLSMHSTRQS